MERESIDVTDYDPEENLWASLSDIAPLSPQMSGPCSPIHQTPMVEEKRKHLASVSKELKRLKTLSITTDRLKSTGAKPLKRLKMFMEETEGGWITVERRFDHITATTDGLLNRSRFGESLGINSNEFALALFDALARGRYMRVEVIDKAQLREYWDQINDQSFESRLFFDIADKDDDGRLTQDEVREFIRLIASDNNLYTIIEKLDEYAALIMEELDPHGLGRIELKSFEILLIELERECVLRTSSEETKKHMMRQRKPAKRWYSHWRSLIVLLDYLFEDEEDLIAQNSQENVKNKITNIFDHFNSQLGERYR